jgi:hypothetical protein
MEIFIMDSSKVKDSFISQQEIITWVNLDSIRSKEGESTIGQENKVMFMKDSSRQVSVMDAELFGGAMEAGMRANLETESKVDGEFSIGREETGSTKEIGITECSTVRVPNTSKMDKDTKAHLKKTSSTEKAYFTKMTQLYTECGRIMSCQLSIWLSQALEINDDSSSHINYSRLLRFSRFSELVIEIVFLSLEVALFLSLLFLLVSLAIMVFPTCAYYYHQNSNEDKH